MPNSAGKPPGPRASRAACRPHRSSAHASSGLSFSNCFYRPLAQELCHGRGSCYAEWGLGGPRRPPFGPGGFPCLINGLIVPLLPSLLAAKALQRRPPGAESAQTSEFRFVRNGPCCSWAGTRLGFWGLNFFRCRV